MFDENTEYKPKPGEVIKTDKPIKFGPPINDTIDPGETLTDIMKERNDMFAPPTVELNDNLLVPMSRNEVAALMREVFEEEIVELREAGQKEYAHNDAKAFANFERTADEVGISREKVLWTFAMKHKDGIAAYINGHKSQREDVRGRINDLIVYLFLLRGMIDERDGVRYDNAAKGQPDPANSG